MKKNKLLSALVIGALAGAMTLATTNPAKASDIIIDGTSVNDNDGPWQYATIGGDREVHTVNIYRTRNYEDWSDDDTTDDLYLSGTGSLTINTGLGAYHGDLYATDGTLTISSGGGITLNSGNSVASAVDLAVAGTLGIGGGSVTIGSGDTVSGTISMSSGSLTINNGATLGSSSTISATGGSLSISGTNTFNSNTAIGSGVNLAVTGGTQTFNTANSIGTAFNNAGTVVLKGGTVNNNINNGASTGTTKIDTGNINTYVYNNAAIANNVYVESGTFQNNSGHSVGGTTTIDTDAAAINYGSLQAVTNSGSLTIAGGTVASVNNSTAASTTTHNAGTVTGNVSNSGTYTLSNTGAISGVVTNGNTFNLKNSGVSKFSQTAGTATLNITDGGSLGLTDGTYTITNGNVVLGEATNNTYGALTVNNGLTTNQAKVTTAGTSTSNSFTVQGAGTQFTTLSGTNFAVGSVTVGDGTNASTLNLSNNGIIGNAVNLTVANASKLNMAGTAQATINTGDIWNGEIKQAAGTTLTVLNNNYTKTTGYLTANGGTVNVGDGATAGTLLLNNANDLIEEAANVIINSDSKITMSNGNVTFDNNTTAGTNDTWNGAIEQTGGTITFINNLVKDSSTAKLTSNGGNIVIGDTVTPVAGTLNLNNTNDSITSATAVTINTNGTLNQSAGAVVLDGTNDNWNGAIALSGTGDLTLSGGSHTTDATKTFNQSAGKLTIDNSGSLTLNTSASKINGTSEVVLGEATGNTAGTLVLNNASANQAKVTTAGTGASAFSVTGAGTAFTTLTGTDFEVGSVTVGDGTNASTFNLSNNGIIAKAVALNVGAASTLNIDGATAQATINTGDTWNGIINQTAGTLTVLNDDYTKTTGYLTSNGGNIVIGDTVTPVAGTLNLNNALDSITSATAVTINTNGTLNQSAGTVALDNTNDNWNGAIALSGTGDLTLNGGSHTTDATKTFNQSAGKLTIDNSGSLTLNTSASKINGTSEVVLGEATNNTKGTLVINNASANQAKVTTAGTGASAFSVTGANTAFTTLTGTNFAVGSVTVGDGTNASTLNLSNNGIIAKAVALNVGAASTLNIDGATAQATINTGDTWKGTINQTNGTLTVMDNIIKDSNTATLYSNGGNIIIGYLGNPSITTDDVAGTLNLNSADYIDRATKVTINTNGTLNQSNGTVYLNHTDGTDTDVWDGAINLSGDGSISIEDFTKATDGTVRYNQNGGLAFLSGTDLTLNKETSAGKESKISNGYIELETGTSLQGSSLKILNGENNNVTLKMNNIKHSLSVGNSSTLVLDSYYDTPTATLLETEIDYGAVNVGTAGTPTDHSVLTVESGTIAQTANVAIQQGAALNITGKDAKDAVGATPAVVAAVTLDGTDTWNGDIKLSNTGAADDTNVSLTLTGVTQTTGANPTDGSGTTLGTQPYYEQSGGSLSMLNNTTLSMADSSLISGGNMTIDSSSVYNSLSNGFSVTNLETAGLINGINGAYENYGVSTAFDVGDALNNDIQADFTTDLYARSNWSNNYAYDTYGTDNGVSTISAVFDQDGDGKNDAVLHVSDWNLNGDIYGWDAPIDRNYGINNLFKGIINANDNINFTSTNKEVFTPIGWYGLHSNGGGNYTFGLNRYNPGVFRGQVTTLAQYQNQLAIDNMLFDHTMVDQGFKGNDYIASNPNRLASAGDLYPPYQYSRKDGGLWLKMYGTFEKLSMSQHMHVENNAYGAIIGADFGLKELRKGWQFMPTAYIAYNGAHQHYNRYSSFQNGGQLGVMGTWYKDNFIIGALAYGGVYGNEMSTPRGDDDALNYFAGTSVKAAYNWRFAKNWALQPNLLVAYNYFGQQNWHSDFGQMGMMSGMLHGVNLAPGVNLIWERETFSIYGTLQYMYNLNQSVGGRAGNVYLPRVSMERGYIQYGLGFNKRFGDRFSGFLQAVFRNAGRTGIGLQAGFQWQLGKGSSSNTAGRDITPELKETKVNLSSNRA